jgi:hypothetical protein
MAAVKANDEQLSATRETLQRIPVLLRVRTPAVSPRAARLISAVAPGTQSPPTSRAHQVLRYPHQLSHANAS